MAGFLRAGQADFKIDGLDGTSLEEIEDWGSGSQRIRILRLLKGGTGNPAGRGINLRHPGGDCSRRDLIGGEVIVRVEDSREGDHCRILGGPSKGSDGRSDIGALAESMRFQAHGLTLGQARFLHGDTTQENAGDGNAVDNRMDENVGGNAGLTKSGHGHES